MKQQNSYSKEFKEEAVKRVIKDGKTGADVGRELGVTKTTVYA